MCTVAVYLHSNDLDGGGLLSRLIMNGDFEEIRRNMRQLIQKLIKFFF